MDFVKPLEKAPLQDRQQAAHTPSAPVKGSSAGQGMLAVRNQLPALKDKMAKTNPKQLEPTAAAAKSSEDA